MALHESKCGRAVANALEAAAEVSVLGVEYLHVRMEDGADLYVTEWGLPFVEQLAPPSHWGDRGWFIAHSRKLPGTSSLYRVRTKEVGGVSKDIVLKWNRMGQDIPGETRARGLATAEFNSPFEEFSLVMELRNSRGRPAATLLTHKPLAILVPRRYVETESLGRRRWRFEKLQKNHREVTLDPNRNYAVIYEWIKGIDAGQAMKEGLITRDVAERLVADSEQCLKQKGYRVKDHKPHHIIVRPHGAGGLARDRDGSILYALVDFELLERTPEHEREVRASRRHTYLSRQPHRFERTADVPPALSQTTVMGVDYVYGRVESSAGALWTVGDDPVLFDYFLPEKWRRTPRTSLSGSGRVFETRTKDDIHLVWRVSRVGQDLPSDAPARARAHGYNSPFEEVALALKLTERGIETTYPRAVYMSGHKPEPHGRPPDVSRHRGHEHLHTPDGHPILSSDHEYMVLWGYWNGPDELLAAHDEDYYRPVDAARAAEEGLVPRALCRDLMDAAKERLARAGVEALWLKPDHLLLSVDPGGRLVMDAGGLPRVRICSFDLLARAPCSG